MTVNSHPTQQHQIDADDDDVDVQFITLRNCTQNLQMREFVFWISLFYDRGGNIFAEDTLADSQSFHGWLWLADCSAQSDAIVTCT